MGIETLKASDRIVALQAHGIDSVDDLLECEWIMNKGYSWDYFKTSCNETWEDDSLCQYADKLNYCPWCGRRIEIKG